MTNLAPTAILPLQAAAGVFRVNGDRAISISSDPDVNPFFRQLLHDLLLIVVPVIEEFSPLKDVPLPIIVYAHRLSMFAKLFGLGSPLIKLKKRMLGNRKS